MQKRCINCGRYFIPDRRIGERQKVCGREACKRERKKKAQENWRDNNPEYFKNHYTDYVKPWRQKKRLLSLMGRPEVIKDKIPFLQAIQVYERLKSYGFTCGYTAVKEYTQPFRKKRRKKAYHELVFLPGQEAQVD